MKKLLVLMTVVVLAMAGQANAELFVNGDFEAGAWSGGGSGSGAAYPWTPMPATLVTDSGGSDGGNWTKLDTTAADFSGSWGWAWSAIWSTPRIAASPSEQYTVSGMAKHIVDATTLRGFVKYFDAAGNQVDYDGQNGVESNPDRLHLTWTVVGNEVWGPFSETFTVPTEDLLGNPFAEPIAEFDVTFSVETEAAAIGVDQLSLVLIPEPATIGLLGLGVLTLLIRRNRFSLHSW